MELQEKIERIVLVLTALLCILIAILDFVGALEAIPWLSQRISIMILLAVGLIALYHVAERNRTFSNLQGLFTKGHNEVLSKISLDQTNQRIVDEINRLWSEREQDIQKFFDEVAINAARGDLASLQEFLNTCQVKFSQGDFFGTKRSFPWDFTIHAIDLKGDFIYHPREELISTRAGQDHGRELLKKKTGTLFWLNHYKSEQIRQLLADPRFKWTRFTKLYFREVDRLHVIVVFESHLNILYQIPKV